MRRAQREIARGHAARELEHLLERLAYALGVFRGEQLGEAHIRVGEREHEEAMRRLAPQM